MKRIVGFMVGVALLGAQSASAIIYEDIHFGLPLSYLDADSNPTYGGTWNILDDGYDPSTQQIDAAIATFVFSDLFLGGSEAYSVTLDGSSFLSGSGVGLAEVLIGGVSGNAFVTLDSTGKLDYLVTAERGNFYLKAAGVLVHVSKCDPRDPPSVPDSGTTVVLLGLGLLALIAIQRRSRVV